MARAVQYCFERYEKKYFLTPLQKEIFLQHIAPYVQPDAYGRYTICNLYYDTPDWRLIRASIEKPIYKEKLRVRSYGVPAKDGRVFAELKKKFDGIVYKRRIEQRADTVAAFLDGSVPAKTQIEKEIFRFQQFYHTAPRVFIAYDREAYAGENGVRVTFDTGIRFRETALSLTAGDHGTPLLTGNRILTEVKIPAACPLWLSHALSEAGATPVSFSKYSTFYRQKLQKEALFSA